MSTHSNLAEAFQAGSAAQHQVVESSSYIQAMIDGRISGESHAAYLRELWYVYRSMERAIIPVLHPVLAQFHDPALHRVEAITSDYRYYTEQESPEHLSPSPAGQVYLQKIQALALEWPLGLLAHHYTRYMGDLAGGQMLKGCVARALKPKPGEGLSAFEFPLIPDPKTYRQNYRQKLNSLTLTHEEEERLVAEVRGVFQLNHSLFLELGASFLGVQEAPLPA